MLGAVPKKNKDDLSKEQILKRKQVERKNLADFYRHLGISRH